MESTSNPSRPGAGRRAPVLAGRSPLIEAFEVVVVRAEERGEGDRGWVLSGSRGVGKTVSLREMLGQVGQRGWITEVEAGAAPSLPIALSLTVDPGGSVSSGVDVEPARGTAGSGRSGEDLVALFEVLGETALDLDVGVLLLVDEPQEAAATDLAALSTAVHELGQADVPLPVVVVGAGLPSLPAQLDDAAGTEALILPARDLGVEWSDDALSLVLRVAGGCPHFLQSVGKHVWHATRRSPTEVDDGLHRSRWERATPAQKNLLRAMAAVAGDGTATVADIASALGRARTSDISVARDEVIKKGAVCAPARGLLAFTVPGRHTFVQRQE